MAASCCSGIMFELDGLDKFSADLKKWKQEVEKDVASVYAGFVSEIFEFVLRETPQWTGNAVSNWNIGVGSPDYSVSSVLVNEAERLKDAGMETIYSKTNPNWEAMEMARVGNSGKLNNLKFLSTGQLPEIFITNASQNILGVAYIQWLEENPGGFLRQENEPGHMLYRAKNQFEYIGELDTSKTSMRRYRSSFI